MGLLRVFRHVATSRIAQVDLGLFDHKHKGWGANQAKACNAWPVKSSAPFCSLMEHEGAVISMDQIPTLEVLYRRVGEGSGAPVRH
ncbi:MAG: hypothetical protein CM15mP116_08430 [Synechococcus sp.]|nr:MAG: hypothetical protein CM15mP116_08430 [Synechococcus sp.]